MEDTSPMTKLLGPQDSNGYYVEDFGNPLNLMLSVPSIVIKGGFEDCLSYIALSASDPDK